MSALQIIAVVALVLVFTGSMGRARLLCGAAQGWPVAPWPVRAALAVLAFCALGRALQIAWRSADVDPTEVGIYCALGAYAAVMAVNMIAQRTTPGAVETVRHRLHLADPPRPGNGPSIT